MQKLFRILIATAATAACLAAWMPVARADVSYYSPPKFKNKVLPVYPDSARAAHEVGTVVLKVLVGADGKAKQYIIFKSSGHKDLDDSVMTAAKASTYSPAVRGSTPTVGFYDVTYNFTLSGVAEDEGSQSDLAKKLDSNPGDAATRVALGTDYLNQKNYSQAEDLFRTGTTTSPNDAKMWAYLGLSYYQDAQASSDPDKYKPAVDAYDKALAIDPKVDTSNVAASAYFNWGFHLQQTGDYADGMTYAQKALALDPKGSENYILVGELQTSQGDYADAVTSLKKAETLDNKQAAIVTSRIIADEANAELSQGDKVDGMADISRSEAADAQAPFAYEYLFSYYVKTGDRAAALTPLNQLAQLQPKEASWQVQIANIYLGENNAAQAKDAFQKALAINPQSPDAQFGMAELSAQNGDTASVASAMKTLTTGADPKTVAVWDSTLAVLFINASGPKGSFWSDAAGYATQATVSDPTNPQGWYALGVADAQLTGKKNDANTALKKAYDIFKTQNNQDMLKAVDDEYKQINGSDISGSSGY
jgi:TonB family protein